MQAQDPSRSRRALARERRRGVDADVRLPGLFGLVLPEHKQKLIEVGFEKRRRQQFLAEQHWWTRFDFSTEDMSAMVEVGEVQMLQALQIALPSMRAPETVMPEVMSLVDSIEIRASAADCEKSLGGAPGLARTVSLKEAHERLIEIAQMAIRALASRAATELSNRSGLHAYVMAEHEQGLAAQPRSHPLDHAQDETRKSRPAAGTGEMAPRFERFIQKWTWRALLFAVTSTELAKRQQAASDMAGLMKEMGSIFLD